MNSADYVFYEKDISSCRKNIFAFISILIITLSIYSNNYGASWHFDDEHNILNRQALHLTEMSWDKVKNTMLWGSKIYRPLPCLSFALNYYFNELNVSGYHVVNNFLHFFTAIIIFLFINDMFSLPALRQKYHPYAYSIAILSSILWAINPMHTQVVTYIVQRMAGMAGFFYIFAMYLYLKARLTTQRPWKIIYLILCGIVTVFAFGSKENAVMLPFSLLLFEILIIRKFSFRKYYIHNKKILLLILITLLSIACIYTYYTMGNNLSGFLSQYKIRTFGLKERLLTESRIIIFYIGQLFYPMPSRLCVNHDFSISHSLFTPPATLLSIIIILCLIIISFAISKKQPLIGFCILFFFINHLVESTFLPLELIFEHRNYIPSMLLFIPVTILFIKIFQFFSQKKSISFLLFFSIAFILVAQGHSTYMRNFTWQTEESLWIDCIDKYPNLWRPYHNLAWFYDKQHKLNQAIPLYEKALTKINYNFKEKVLTYNNIGVAYQRMGNYEKALYYYNESEKYYPYYVPIIVHRGTLFLERGLYLKALAELKNALAQDSDNPSAYCNLGYLALIRGENDNAILYLKKSIKNGGNSSLNYRLLGYAYAASGQSGRALLALKKSRKMESENPVVLLHMAVIYYNSGMIIHYNRAINDLIKYFQGNSKNMLVFFKELEKGKLALKATLPESEILYKILYENFSIRQNIYKEIIALF